MSDINIWAVGVATVAAFVVSGIWYGIFGGAMSKLQKKRGDSGMPPWKVFVEVLRSFVVVLLFAIILPQLGVADLQTAVGYAVMFWLAFPVVLLVGSIVHENVPVKLAAIHVGDWLVKLLVLAAVLTLWR